MERCRHTTYAFRKTGSAQVGDSLKWQSQSSRQSTHAQHPHTASSTQAEEGAHAGVWSPAVAAAGGGTSAGSPSETSRQAKLGTRNLSGTQTRPVGSLFTMRERGFTAPEAPLPAVVGPNACTWNLGKQAPCRCTTPRFKARAEADARRTATPDHAAALAGVQLRQHAQQAARQQGRAAAAQVSTQLTDTCMQLQGRVFSPERL